MKFSKIIELVGLDVEDFPTLAETNINMFDVEENPILDLNAFDVSSKPLVKKLYGFNLFLETQEKKTSTNPEYYEIFTMSAWLTLEYFIIYWPPASPIFFAR